jgi:hypothetical protein
MHAEIYGSFKNIHTAREAMQNATQRSVLLFLDDPENVLIGIAIVDDHRQRA